MISSLRAIENSIYVIHVDKDLLALIVYIKYSKISNIMQLLLL